MMLSPHTQTQAQQHQEKRKLKQSVPYLPLILCAALAACNPSTPALNQPHQQAPSAQNNVMPVVKASQSPLELESKPQERNFELSVTSDGKTDTIRSKQALEANFKTQAFDRSELGFVQFSVKGPGITGSIDGPMIDLSTIPGAPTDLSQVPLTLSNIPIGTNRIVTAQFFDSTETPIPLAVAKGFYSSGGAGSTINLSLRRRFLPLARVIEKLMLDNPALVPNLNLNQMQTEIQKMLFGGDGTVVNPSFTVDPILLDTDQMAATLNAANGVIGANTLNDASYIKTTGTLRFPNVPGLVGGDLIEVRVEDPTSNLVSVPYNIGQYLLNNVAPGEWPVSITLPSTMPYTITPSPGTIPYTYDPVTRKLRTKLSFTAGSQTTLGLSIAFQTAEISQVSPNQGLRNSQITLTGQNFTTVANRVRVIFKSVNDATEFQATVVSASATQIVAEVPQVTQSGDYDILLSINDRAATESVRYNVLGIWHVTENGNPTASGKNWSEATTLQSALQNASPGDEIWLKTGVYKPHASDRTASFYIDKSLKILGGFAGNEVQVSARNPELNPVTLSGDLLGNENYTNPTGPVDIDPDSELRSDNSYHVVMVDLPMTEAVLDGLSIVGGNANNPAAGETVYYPPGCIPDLPDPPEDYYCSSFTVPDPYKHGGGIENYGELTLKNVKIRYNSAIGNGAGINHAGRFLTIGKDRYTGMEVVYHPVTIEHNLSKDKGGGLYLDGPNGIWHSVFKNNAAQYGGGIAAHSAGEGLPEIYNNLIENNTATQHGGGVYSTTGIELWLNILSGNVAELNGGGVYQEVGGPIGDGKFNVFTLNSAQRGGGYYLKRQNGGWGANVMSNWTFFRNEANQSGDALFYEGLTGGGGGPLDLKLINMLFFDDMLGRNGETSFILERSLSNGPEASLVNSIGEISKPALNILPPGASFFNADPLFSNPENPSGGDGWGTGIEGLRPSSASVAKNQGSYVHPNPGDKDAGGVARIPANSSHIGAYVAEEGL